MRPLIALATWLACSGAVADALAPVTPAAQTADGLRRGWTVDGQNREAVRLFYTVLLRPGAPAADFWQGGSVAGCQPGETTASHRSLTLARINAYRAMAGLPADLVEDLAATPKAQAAALLAAANRQISHQVPADWRCADALARSGAEQSALALGANGVEAIDDFMRDAGEQNRGANHRRWLLYPQTLSVGLGDVPGADAAGRASAFTAFDGMFGSARPPLQHEFVAWPPPGWVPYPLVFARWSFGLAGADFSQATVALRRDGELLPLTREAQQNGAGESTLVWRLAGMPSEASWPRPDADSRIEVEIGAVGVAGTLRDFHYRVTVFDPDALAPAWREASIAGPGRIDLAGADYAVLSQPGATGHQWRALQLDLTPLHDDAEAERGLLAYQGAGGYALRRKLDGGWAYRLAHVQAGDEILAWPAALVLGSQPRLRFRSRLGIAGADERALVEIRPEGARDWQVLSSQASSGQPKANELEWQLRDIDLSAYAQRQVQLRFRYQFAHGDYFSPDDGRVGWYLDALQLDDGFRLASIGPAQPVSGGRWQFVPAQAGNWCLQARPLVYGAAGEWGPVWPVQVKE